MLILFIENRCSAFLTSQISSSGMSDIIQRPSIIQESPTPYRYSPPTCRGPNCLGLWLTWSSTRTHYLSPTLAHQGWLLVEDRKGSILNSAFLSLRNFLWVFFVLIGMSLTDNTVLGSGYRTMIWYLYRLRNAHRKSRCHRPFHTSWNGRACLCFAGNSGCHLTSVS